MTNVNTYIENGVVLREKIAIDIKYGVLGKDDIAALVADQRVRDAFIGTDYAKKIPAAQWNQEYLDKLSYAAVAEAFNEDYLRYLHEVAASVNGSKSNRISKGVVIGAVVAVAVVAVVVWLLVGRGASVDSVSSVGVSGVSS